MKLSEAQDYTAQNERMNNELERIWMEAVMA
jgi:hypothetical protein